MYNHAELRDVSNKKLSFYCCVCMCFFFLSMQNFQNILLEDVYNIAFYCVSYEMICFVR